MVEAAPRAHLGLEHKLHVFAVSAPVRAQMHGIGRALPELAGVAQDGVARPEFKLGRAMMPRREASRMVFMSTW